ncbi:hypothetical protein B0H16DRAFT_1892202 [Mycena metata]|uniref:F-box domain-containing protein n=1 Tax=Mycena metata TaxID=1033252 RepID=A0AAD7MY09_9AGAR|nr:hypothetical protein B0H16DRAFT_1892202 [Mycena metata]
MISLPQELVDAIIDQVDDNLTLKSCALVSGSFLSSAQRKLFRAIQIFDTQKSLPDHSHFLSESPHIAFYIRDLTIRSDPDDHTALIHIFAVARNVERFNLILAEMPNENPGFMPALVDYLSRPTLRFLGLFYTQGVPSTVISAAMAVLSVFFWRVSMDATEFPQSDVTPRVRQLSLLYSGSAVLAICDFLLHPGKSLYTDHIEYVEIRMDSDSASYDHRFLSACAGTLRFLAIDPGALEDTINLPYLPFVLGVEIEILVDANRQLPHHFPSTLKRIASSLPAVETITLSFPVLPRQSEIAWPDQGVLPILGPSFKERTELLHLR